MSLAILPTPVPVTRPDGGGEAAARALNALAQMAAGAGTPLEAVVKAVAAENLTTLMIEGETLQLRLSAQLPVGTTLVVTVAPDGSGKPALQVKPQPAAAPPMPELPQRSFTAAVMAALGETQGLDLPVAPIRPAGRPAATAAMASPQPADLPDQPAAPAAGPAPRPVAAAPEALRPAASAAPGHLSTPSVATPDKATMPAAAPTTRAPAPTVSTVVAEGRADGAGRPAASLAPAATILPHQTGARSVAAAVTPPAAQATAEAGAAALPALPARPLPQPLSGATPSAPPSPAAVAAPAQPVAAALPAATPADALPPAVPASTAKPADMSAPRLLPDGATPLAKASPPPPSDLPRPPAIPYAPSPRPTMTEAGPTPAQQPAAGLARAVATQQPLAPMLADAVRLAGSAALPQAVRTAASEVVTQALDPSRTPIDAKALRMAVAAASGLRAPGAPPAADLTARLAALRDLLDGMLGGDVLRAVPDRKRHPGLPLRGDAPQAERSVMIAAGDEPPHTLANRLLGEADGALSRLKLLQAASQPTGDRPTDPARPAELRVDVPMLLGREATAIQFVFEREARPQDTKKPRGWRMRLALHVAALGDVGAEIGIYGKSAQVSIWAAESETEALIAGLLPELGPALAAHGLEPGAIRIRTRGSGSGAPGRILDSAG